MKLGELTINYVGFFVIFLLRSSRSILNIFEKMEKLKASFEVSSIFIVSPPSFILKLFSAYVNKL